MGWVKTVAVEIFGLFVDDGRFAIAVLVWLCLVAFLLPLLAIPAGVKAPLLAVGLAVILVASATLRARS